MGKRVHVVKTQRHYGNTEAFNWSFIEFYNLLEEMGGDVCRESEDEDTDFAELPVEDYKTIMGVFKTLRDGKKPSIKTLNKLGFETRKDFDDFNYQRYLDIFGLNLEDFCSILQDFYKERDKKAEWIQFEAW